MLILDPNTNTHNLTVYARLPFDGNAEVEVIDQQTRKKEMLPYTSSYVDGKIEAAISKQFKKDRFYSFTFLSDTGDKLNSSIGFCTDTPYDYKVTGFVAQDKHDSGFIVKN